MVLFIGWLTNQLVERPLGHVKAREGCAAPWVPREIRGHLAYTPRRTMPDRHREIVQRAELGEDAAAVIGQRARLRAVILEIPRLFEADAADAADALDRALRTASLRDLAWIERQCREHAVHHGEALRAWRRVEPRDLDAMLRFGAADQAVCGLLSFHRNGYVREAAVRRLAGLTLGFELRFLLLRLNDYVPPVRAAAQSAVDARVRPELAEALVQALPLVEQLASWKRAGHGPTVRAVREVLMRPDVRCRAALHAGARDAEAEVRAASLRLSSEVEPLADVLEVALADRDSRVRDWAARITTSSRASEADRDRLLPLLEADRSPRIRARALRARVKREEPRPHLERALLDPNAAVRYLARVSLRALGAVGSRDTYLRALRASPDAASIAGALGGLADLGTREDAAVAAAFLRDPRVRVRAEACRAVGALDRETFRDALAAMRSDPSPRVAREAERVSARG